MNRLLLPFAVALAVASPSLSKAQTYTQMQWGMNKTVSPYNFGVNINGAWKDLGTVTSGGVWNPSNLGGATGSGNFVFNGAGKTQTLDSTFESTFPTNAVAFSSNGASIWVNPVWAALAKYRTSGLFAMTTTPGVDWESTLALETLVNTGDTIAFSNGLAVTAGQYMVSCGGNPECYVYKVKTSGTTAGAGNGPTGKGTGITNGTAVFDYANYYNFDAKIAFTNTVKMMGDAGRTWAQNQNLSIFPLTHAPNYVVGTEWDVYNASGFDSALGTPWSVAGFNMFFNGPNKSTLGGGITSTGNPGIKKLEWGWGVFSPDSVNEASFVDNASGKYGLAICEYSVLLGYGCNHSIASIGDRSTSETLLRAGGSYVNGLWLEGTFSSWQILGSNFTVSPTGALLAQTLTSYSDFAKWTLLPANGANNYAWRGVSNVNGAGTDGSFVIQHTNDKFAANFTNFTFGASGNFDAASFTSGGAALLSSGWKVSNLAVSSTAPTISSGFGTSPSIVASNGTAAFQVNVGTGGTASSGVIGLPTATNGWSCSAANVTTNTATVFLTKQTASTTTSVTVTNYNTAGAATAWVASDKLNIKCVAF